MHSRSLIASVAVAAIVGTAPADTIRVPADQPSIQSAIDHAVDGDTVLVSPGIWIEHLDLGGKDLVIRGDGLAADVVLASPDGGTMLRVDAGGAAESTFSDLTFTGGMDNALIRIGDASPTFDRCLFRDNVAAAVVDEGTCGDATGGRFVDCGFIRNSAMNGGAMYSLHSDTSLDGCAFVDNLASGQPAPYVSAGGAFYVNNWGCGLNAVTIRNCDFIDNTAVWGGAMYAQGVYPSAATDLVIDGCRFISNQANQGRSLWLWYIDGDISSSYFCGGGDQIHNGWGDMGGNVFTDDCGSAEIDDCDGDRVPDALAITLGLADDCNGDGRPDPCTAGDTKIDADGDGIPDVCQSTACPADLSGDGVVNGGDLGIWLSLADRDCRSGSDCPADVNGDGLVDGTDLESILTTWGPCPE